MKALIILSALLLFSLLKYLAMTGPQNDYSTECAI